MAEYIEREAAVAVLEERQKALCPVGKWSRNQANDCEKFDAYQELIDELNNIPAVDFKFVPHAQWIPFHAEFSGDIQYCSACGIGYPDRPAFCPHCGAIMDGWRTEAAENE